MDKQELKDIFEKVINENQTLGIPDSFFADIYIAPKDIDRAISKLETNPEEISKMNMLYNSREFIKKATQLDSEFFQYASPEIKLLCRGMDPVKAITKAEYFEANNFKIPDGFEVAKFKESLDKLINKVKENLGDKLKTDTIPYLEDMHNRVNDKIAEVSERKLINCYKKFVAEDPYNLPKIPDSYRDNKDIVMEAVTQNGKSLRFASDRLKNDIEVAIAAVAEDGLAIELVSTGLKKNESLATLALAQNPSAYRFIDESLKAEKKFALLGVKDKQGYDIYDLLPANLQKDKDVVKGAIKADPYILANFTPNDPNYLEYVKYAVKLDENNIQHGTEYVQILADSNKYNKVQAIEKIIEMKNILKNDPVLFDRFFDGVSNIDKVQSNYQTYKLNQELQFNPNRNKSNSSKLKL